MKAVVAAFNQEKDLVGAFSVITNLRMQLFEALVPGHDRGAAAAEAEDGEQAAAVLPPHLQRGPHGAKPAQEREDCQEQDVKDSQEQNLMLLLVPGVTVGDTKMVSCNCYYVRCQILVTLKLNIV